MSQNGYGDGGGKAPHRLKQKSDTMPIRAHWATLNSEKPPQLLLYTANDAQKLLKELSKLAAPASVSSEFLAKVIFFRSRWLLNPKKEKPSMELRKCSYTGNRRPIIAR